MNITDLVDNKSLRDDIPDFQAGDTVKVHVRVVEGNKERTQVFEGVVIARRGSGINESFTVRKLSFGVGVERTFPVHTPIIDKIERVTRGDVRRAKLTLRTVKVSRMPLPWRAMTAPSNTWTRSRLPSTTRTCTLRVSPAPKSGMSSRKLALSTRSVGFMAVPRDADGETGVGGAATVRRSGSMRSGLPRT